MWFSYWPNYVWQHNVTAHFTIIIVLFPATLNNTTSYIQHTAHTPVLYSSKPMAQQCFEGPSVSSKAEALDTPSTLAGGIVQGSWVWIQSLRHTGKINITTTGSRCFTKQTTHRLLKEAKDAFLFLVRLTFDLQTRLTEGLSVSSVWIWCKCI